MERFLFNTGNGHYGLIDFQYNLVKICIEDRQFYNENWEMINPNDYGELDVRTLLNYLQTLKKNGTEISYDRLKLYAHTKKQTNFQILNDIIDSIKERELSEEERNKIKEEYTYFGLYASMLTLSNNIREWAEDGYKFKKQITEKYKQVLIWNERMNKQYQRILSNIEMDDTTVKETINDNW